MGFTVSSLTNYVIENENEILRASIFGAKTAGLVNVQAGIKSSEKLNILTADVEFQADSSCSYNSSGSTTFTQRTLSVSDIAVMQTWCPKDLEAKYTQKRLKAGSEQEDLPFEQEIMDELTEKLQKRVEVALWQGATTNTFDTNLVQFDGFVKVIDDAATAVTGNTGGQTSITTSNALTIVENIYQVIPTSVLDKDDLVCFMGMDTFRKLVINLRSANLFHYDASNTMGELRLPWAENLRVIGVNGLNADNHASLPTAYKNRIFAGRLSNFYLGTDLASDAEEVSVWYSKDDRNIKSLTSWKMGTQVAFPSEIVQYTNA